MTDIMDIRERLGSRKLAVDRALEELLGGAEGGLAEVMRYAVLGAGKRFRPLLLLASGEAAGGDEAVLMPYACAVELIHNYSLVHDDLPCMDDDDMRRGLPTCHKKFGESAAVLAGDALFSLAFEVLASAGCGSGGPAGKEQAIREIAAASGPAGLVGGQWLDLNPPADASGEAAYFDMAGRKTGALIRASVTAGAHVAGAGPGMLQAFETYGRAVGLAFQLRDDIMDFGATGSPSRVDAVTVLSAGAARARLAAELVRASEALRGAGRGSEGLAFLAGSLAL